MKYCSIPTCEDCGSVVGQVSSYFSYLTYVGANPSETVKVCCHGCKQGEYITTLPLLAPLKDEYLSVLN